MHSEAIARPAAEVAPRKPAWRRWATALFLAVVAALLANQVRRIDWAAVGVALQSYAPPTLLLGLALATASHAVYASYELVGKHLTAHHLERWRSAAIGIVSYAFNLNFGSLVGGVGLRWRLYVHHGLPPTKAGQLIGISMLCNWIGYVALGGLLFAWQPLELPPQWRIDTAGLRWIGVAMLSATAVYVIGCALAPRRRWTIRGHPIVTPSGGIALLQVAASALNWLTIATLIWLLLGRRVELVTTASVFLVAAMAGVLLHVPAGIGVLEMVFVTLLSHRIAEPELLAALLVYRALYYLLPLGGAGVLWWWLEKRPHHRRAIIEQQD